MLSDGGIQMPESALSDVKVVELSEFISGPYCTKMLADLGAEVIKVEKPGTGDITRRLGPFPNDVPNPECSGQFLYLNANKMGITLDIKSSTGKKILKELISQADIFVETNPKQMTEELGLDYESLKKLNSRLVMTSITPFGQTGPYRDYKAYPLNSYHGSGLGYLGPSLEGEPRPIKTGGLFSEGACGVLAALGTLSALYHQRMSGLGQQVDVSVQESVAWMTEWHAVHWDARRETLPRGQMLFPVTIRRTQMWPCKDGYVVCTYQGGQEANHRMIPFVEWVEEEGMADDFLRGLDWEALDFRAMTQEQVDSIEEPMRKFFLAHTKADRPS